MNKLLKTKDEMFDKVWKDIQKFRADYKEWASVGFLPRPAPPTSSND